MLSSPAVSGCRSSVVMAHQGYDSWQTRCQHSWYSARRCRCLSWITTKRPWLRCWSQGHEIPVRCSVIYNIIMCVCLYLIVFCFCLTSIHVCTCNLLNRALCNMYISNSFIVGCSKRAFTTILFCVDAMLVFFNRCFCWNESTHESSWSDFSCIFPHVLFLWVTGELFALVVPCYTVYSRCTFINMYIYFIDVHVHVMYIYIHVHIHTFTCRCMYM